ncbi:MAG: molybdopterin-dependent oxidoreductase [Candidatus Altiarchaeota archaeon]
MRKKNEFWTILLLTTLVFAFISGCIEGENVIELEGVEVRNYEGAKLSSVEDFRENSIKGPQHIDKDSYVLEVGGLVDEPATYTYDEVVGGYQKYSKVVTLYCVEGWDVTILWEGVKVWDIIEKSRPQPQANTVIFYAIDGYSTSFPVEYIRDNPVIMAYKMNNVTLPPERGFPFQLVAEDKWGYKWIKWITQIELSDNADYKGYWERRGYSNSGDLNGSKFEE